MEVTSTCHPRRWEVLWILCGSLVLVVVSVSSLNVAIPTIQRSLDVTGSELQWIIDAYALLFAGMLLPAGAIGDRYGRRGALVAGLTLFALTSLGGMLSDTAAELIFRRGLMGVGAAFIMPATLSIVATVFPPDERARAIGIWAGFAGAGGVIGLISSGLLLESFGWTSVFLVNLPIVALMLIAVVRVVPTSRDENATPLDPVGAVLSMFGLLSLVYGIIEGPEVGWTSTQTVGAFALATFLLTAFVVWELRAAYPLLDPRLFAKPEFSLGSLAITVAFFGIFGMFFVITQYFQFVQGHTALGAGVRILPYGLVLLVVSPRAATLAERFGERAVITTGMVIAAVGFALLSLSRPDTAYGFVGAALVLVACGTGLLMPPATAAIVASLPPSKAGVGSAVNDTTREVGGAIGIAIVGALVSVGYRESLAESLASLDPTLAELGHDSIGAMLAATANLAPELAQPAVDVAVNAFSDGVRLAMVVAAGVLVATAAVVSTMYPKAKRTTA